MKIGILGAAGRMGQMLVREIESGAYPCTLGAAIDKDTKDKDAAFRACDALIDFTTPDGVREHAALAEKHAKALVIGTTGLTADDEKALHAAAQKAPMLYSANMSLGVNALAALVEQVAAKLDESFDIEIFEAHHRHKTDAPSGTALLLARAAAKGRGVKLDDVLAIDRAGKRKTGDIGMSVFRGGDVVGDHTVTFAGSGERVELTHKASDRAVLRQGRGAWRAVAEGQSGRALHDAGRPRLIMP